MRTLGEGLREESRGYTSGKDMGFRSVKKSRGTRRGCPSFVAPDPAALSVSLERPRDLHGAPGTLFLRFLV